MEVRIEADGFILRNYAVHLSNLYFIDRGVD